jgi:hypothetical protein
MSGRLIILPKKSYCPWNSKNVERVLRDERLHAEEQQQELEQVQKEASEVRLQALKKGNKVENKELEHVNLFRAEEERELQQQLLKSKQGEQNNKLCKGIQPLYLGQSAKNAKQFVNHSTQSNKHHRLSDKEHRQKERMDPMHMFHSTQHESKQITSRPLQSPISQEDLPDCSKLKPPPTDGEREEKKRKKKRRSSRHHGSRKGDSLTGEEDVESESSSDDDDDDDDDDGRKRREKRNRKRRRSEDRQQQRERKREKRHGRKSSRKSHNDQSENQEESIEQLRKRRAEREEREKQRQHAVVQDKYNPPPSIRYMDQYNPNLSRR